MNKGFKEAAKEFIKAMENFENVTKEEVEKLELENNQKISELTVGELKGIIREIIREEISKVQPYVPYTPISPLNPWYDKDTFIEPKYPPGTIICTHDKTDCNMQI